MGRPRMPIGTFGTISTTQIAPGRWRARTLHRFSDGKRRQVQRVRAGRTDVNAVNALKEALVAAEVPGDRDLKTSTHLSVLAALFLQSKRDAARAPRTVAAYEHTAQTVILPRIGDLSVEEATAGRLQPFFTAVTKEHGPGAAKMSKSVLSGMFRIAIKHQIASVNPIRDVDPITPSGRRAAEALPAADVVRFITAIRCDEVMRRLDLADLFAFMLFTGCRVGEAVAVRWSGVDLDARKVTFAGTVVRIAGEGLLLQEHGKTETSTRTISVGQTAVTLLQSREQTSDVVFPALSGALRDPVEVQSSWRVQRERLGWPSVTTHSFRKTTATTLDAQGLSARAIADYLGHRHPSMTQDRYMARNLDSTRAAQELDQVYAPSNVRS